MQDFDGKGAKGRRSKEEIQKRNKEVSHHGQGIRHLHVFHTHPLQVPCAPLTSCFLKFFICNIRSWDVMQAQQRFRDRQKVRRNSSQQYDLTCNTSLFLQPARCR